MLHDQTTRSTSVARAHAGRPRLATLVWLRAIAIVFIVMAHSCYLFGSALDTVTGHTFNNFIQGVTALFVFISGFVFDYIFGDRYRYGSFLRDRIKKLLIPYCLLTTLAGFMFSSWMRGEVSSDEVFSNFVLGTTFQAYWYIPFILVMFALAPLHRLFMDLRASKQTSIILVCLIVGGLVQRPVGNLNVLQSVVFYTPAYLSGLYLSLHLENLLPVLKKWWFLLLLGTALLVGIQTVNGQVGNLHKPFFVIQGFELMGLQKIVFAFALVGFFARFSPLPGRIVHIIADTSFAIFFLHPFVLRLCEGSPRLQLTPLPWINLAIVSTGIVTLCALFATALHALLKTNSKYLIGY